ncbi:MAG TPA: DUF503 domain-containing protein [Acidimicrobiales bacterium]|nr:DUF503 domain-containing protein [Acidimicrobiales bacterium]
MGALAFELHLPDVHSLKEKRAVVRPIVDGARRRFAVSAAEVDHQDLWQRATLAMAVVSGTESQARDVLDAVERFVWSFVEVEVVDTTLRWMEVER